MEIYQIYAEIAKYLAISWQIWYIFLDGWSTINFWKSSWFVPYFAPFPWNLGHLGNKLPKFWLNFMISRWKYRYFVKISDIFVDIPSTKMFHFCLILAQICSIYDNNPSKSLDFSSKCPKIQHFLDKMSVFELNLSTLYRQKIPVFRLFSGIFGQKWPNICQK